MGSILVLRTQFESPGAQDVCHSQREGFMIICSSGFIHSLHVVRQLVIGKKGPRFYGFTSGFFPVEDERMRLRRNDFELTFFDQLSHYIVGLPVMR